MEYKDTTIIYESTLKAMDLLLDDDSLWREAMTGLLRYGFYGEEPYSDDRFVQAVWIQSMPSMKNAKERYAKAVENGKKGGRPTDINIDTILQYKKEGKTNKEIAKLCGCSEKNIERYITEYNKKKEDVVNTELETSTYTYSDTDIYTETDTDTERFQGLLGGANDKETSVNLDVVEKVLEMYKQGKNYDQMKETIQKQFQLAISGKELHNIIDKRSKYESDIEKHKQNKADAARQQKHLEIRAMHDAELSKAPDVVKAFKKHGIDITEEQVRQRYTNDMIEGEIGCWGWCMANLIHSVNTWPIAYQGLSGVKALNSVLNDIATSCVDQSDRHMEYKVQKIKQHSVNNKADTVSALLDVFDEEL